MKILVDFEDKGSRLDALLVKKFPDKSRNYFQIMIKNGDILVNNNTVKAGYILAENDEICIVYKEPIALDMTPLFMELDIVYEDAHILVVNKQRGIVTHPSESYKGATLVHGLLYQIDNLSSINGVMRPGIVHRLDKETSGLLVVAKTEEAHKALSLSFKNRDVVRVYHAIVAGTISHKEGRINAPIGRNPKDRLKNAIIAGGKEAITDFRVLEETANYSLVECRLVTGRTHQIRLHMAFIGNPVVGDVLYGKGTINSYGQLLHSKTIGFKHPITKEHLEFSSSYPEHFKKALEVLFEGV